MLKVLVVFLDPSFLVIFWHLIVSFYFVFIVCQVRVNNKCMNFNTRPCSCSVLADDTYSVVIEFHVSCCARHSLCDDDDSDSDDNDCSCSQHTTLELGVVTLKILTPRYGGPRSYRALRKLGFWKWGSLVTVRIEEMGNSSSFSHKVPPILSLFSSSHLFPSSIPLPLEVGPLIIARGHGEALNLPQRVWGTAPAEIKFGVWQWLP